MEEAPRVQDAINAITEPEIGVHMEMQLFDFGEYATQMGLMAASGEQLTGWQASSKAALDSESCRLSA